ncbi:unnamed protein product, partial [Symbiodinium sp. KB8]
YEEADTFIWKFINRWYTLGGLSNVGYAQEYEDGFPARRLKIIIEELERIPEGLICALSDVFLKVKLHEFLFGCFLNGFGAANRKTAGCGPTALSIRARYDYAKPDGLSISTHINALFELSGSTETFDEWLEVLFSAVG